MSAIRPTPAAPLYLPQPAAQAPARASRTDFFLAALDAVQSTPMPSTPAAAAPRSAPDPSAERSTRPGALLDIRV